MEQHENDNTVDTEYDDLHAELEKYRAQERKKISRRKFVKGIIVGVVMGIIVGGIMGIIYQRTIYFPGYMSDMHNEIYLSEDKRSVIHLVMKPVDGAADPLNGATLIAFTEYDKQEVSDLIKHLTKLRKQMR